MSMPTFAGSPAMHTASQIALALVLSKRRVLLKLGVSRADGVSIVNGQTAPAWRLTSLPAPWQEKLRGIAAKRGYRDVEALLAAPCKAWKPALPLAETAEQYVEKAAKLRRALAGPLARRNDLSLRESEYRAMGLRDYQSAFGHSISEKQWCRLLERTVDRDAGAENWERLEIYLAENCAPKTRPQSVRAVQIRCDHQSLASLLAAFSNPLSPSETERHLLWQYAFDRTEDLVTEGMPLKSARLSVLKFLQQHASFLADSPNALRVAFERKLARWKANGAIPQSLADLRPKANATRRKVLPEEDRRTLLAFAAKHGGGISQGWREARRRGVLGLETVGGYIENPRSKSYVPAAIRADLRHDAEMLEDWMRGPRAAKLGGAYIERNPETFAAGDWYQGDDCTLPNYYYEETEQGVRLMRGQFLAMVDCRTTCILGFVLISAELDRPSSYNAWHIRNLITHVHDTYGLPRKGFAFENGTWRAKLLTGGPSWDETESGLCAFGIRFLHSRLPRAKVIERVFGSLQNLCEAQPGYVGRNEQVDKWERVQQQKRLVQSGKAPAHQYFLSRDEWVEQLDRLCAQYNAETQNGKYLPGLSPSEGYERFFGNEPQVRLPDTARYLLANEQKKLRVGQNGISFLSRQQRFTYKSEETGRLRGRDVEVFFNYEAPDLIGVKDPATGEAFAVRRATVPDAFDATAETLQQAYGENEAHESYRRALYRSIAPAFSEHFLARPIFRGAMVDAATVEAGQRIAADAERQMEQARQEERLQREVSKATRGLGMSFRPGRARAEGQLAAAQDLERLLAKADAQQEQEIE